MKIPNISKIIIQRTDKPNILIDAIIEKVCRTGKKYNVQCTIISKTQYEFK